MIQSLTIKNTAIIDKLTVEFGEGLNCLSGETGAGKSIIIDSICCLLGERSSRENIRNGCESASVQGVFYDESEAVLDLLEEFGIDVEDDGTLILFREYGVSGKNICRINGQAVTLSMLKKLGETLIDIHGQHDSHALLMPASHIDILDAFGGEEITAVKTRYKSAYAHLHEIDAEIKSLSGDPEERQAKIDLLSFQIEEIKSAEFKIGEEEELEDRRKVLANAEDISVCLNGTYARLTESDGMHGSVCDALYDIQSDFEKISEYSEKYSELLEKINDAVYALEDVTSVLRREKDEDLYNKEEADEIDERLELIFKLKRKYGATIKEILKFCDEAAEKLSAIENSAERYDAALKERASVCEILKDLCEDLNFMRAKAALILESNISGELSDMDMSKVKFKAKIDYENTDDGEEISFGKNGLDSVEFLVSTNPGEPPRPLAKIASGGELSRIMLAIKCVLAEIDNTPTLIFDEIDTGISGQTAISVGTKFKKLSKNHQVICVTHLAQIAAIANHNIFVSKVSLDEQTRTSVKVLNGDEKVLEICRLLDGGEITETTIGHAKELIQRLSK
ncbi:MAG: DNA repair protein RecN [Ruminococcaceae bacterium]|nr:DNA repair protein RecN [Oscillospiraceae bacterium]